MATSTDIEELRDYVGEPDNTSGWTDQKLGAYVDRGPTLFDAAASVWGAKAASYAKLVNVSESGSSRNLGELQKNALAMSAYYRAMSREQATLPPATPQGPIISNLTRP